MVSFTEVLKTGEYIRCILCTVSSEDMGANASSSKEKGLHSNNKVWINIDVLFIRNALLYIPVYSCIYKVIFFAAKFIMIIKDHVGRSSAR